METKKAKAKVVVSVLALAGLLLLPLSGQAGNLEPSAPPGPTMKTLDEVEPRIPIHASDLPLTITEPNSYYFAENISFEPNDTHAITIGCDDVTIDLMGFTLKGPNSGTQSGIYMNNRANVAVRNGTVRDFYYGVREHSGSGSLATGKHRVINVRAISNISDGISLKGYGNFVQACSAEENGDFGIRVGGNGGIVTGNNCYNNSVGGILVNQFCILTGNTVHFNGDYGIYASRSCRVIGNTVCGHPGDGIKVYRYCIVTDNTCDYNGNNGDGAGIHATGIGNRIERNHVSYNDRGIDVDSTSNLIVKNSAVNNTTEYDIVGGNKVGTISIDPTTAGPWDNFDF